MVATFFVGLLNGCIKGLSFAVSVVLALLPSWTPLSGVSTSGIVPYLGFVNWMMPIGQMMAVLTVWGGCIGIYYVYQVILRWGKVVE